MYQYYGKINRGQVICLLYRGCPLFGGSVILNVYATCTKLYVQVCEYQRKVPASLSLFFFLCWGAGGSLQRYGLKICALAACSPYGSVYLQWMCLVVCYGQDEIACHLHPILCTCDAVALQSPFSFHLGCSQAQKKKKKKKKHKQTNQTKNVKLQTSVKTMQG